jgi:hypothetical protein
MVETIINEVPAHLANLGLTTLIPSPLSQPKVYNSSAKSSQV